MKKIKTIFTVLFATALFSSVTAQTVSGTQEVLTVKYIGTDGSYLLFKVDVNTGNAFSQLKIADKIEGELFSQNWKASGSSRTFKIEKKDYQQLSFTLQVGKKSYTKVFSSNIDLIETIIISETEVVKL